jgi:chaperonin GroES
MELDVNIKIEKLLASPNIAEMLDDQELTTVGSRVVQEFNLDKDSRSVWEQRVEEAMKLALQVAEAKSFPWSGASNVKFPLITIAALQFHSRAYPALIPSNQIVKLDIPAYLEKQQDEQDIFKNPYERAKRVETHMSYQILTEDENWESEMDKVLITVPIIGCAFKKTYWDFNKNHPVSENILAKDFVVSYWTKSLKDCTRQTHVLYLSSNDVLSRIRRGLWLDVNLGNPILQPQDNLGIASDKQQGTSIDASDTGTPYEFLEQHRWEDLDGDGYKEPYIVTVHRPTGKVVRIVANYLDSSIKRNTKNEIINIEPESYFTKYSFIPSPDGGFYDIGFGILLGPLNESIDTIINQLIDAGTMATTAGGFLSRGIKVRGGNYNFAPLEWKHVDSTGEDLAKGIVPLPVREPSATLFQLLTTLVNYGERIVGATDIMVGEDVGQNTPAETARTMAEQGQKVFAGIFKRIHRSLKEEFKKVFRLNQLYLVGDIEYSQGFIRASDYIIDDSTLRPFADPNVVTDVQKVMQAQALMQAASTVPGFNMYEVTKRYLEALKISNIDQVLPDPQGPNAIQPQPDAKLQIAQIKAQADMEESKGKFQLQLAKLQEDARMNEARILKLQAEALLALEQADDVPRNNMIALIQAEIGAAKHKQQSLYDSIKFLKDMMPESGQSASNDSLKSGISSKIVQGENVNGSNQGGIPGMEGAPSDQSVAQGSPQ